MIAVSTRCTAVFHDLDLTLPAGVPVTIPASAAARVLEIPGVQVQEDPSDTPTTDKE